MTRADRKAKKLQEQCDEFNANAPIGTEVLVKGFGMDESRQKILNADSLNGGARRDSESVLRVVASRATRSKDKQPRRFWSAEDLARLVKLYPDRPTAEIAKALDRTALAVYQTAAKLDLKKTEAFLASEESRCRLRKGSTIGAQFRFPKGHVPANKGLRRPGYHAGRMKETQFQKGCRSGIAARNWQPIGTIMPDADGYQRIKVREAQHGKKATGFGNTKVWPLLNRYLWEQHKGPIPPKHIVIFKDGDRSHCEIENLDLISMAENARRNRMWNKFPRELAEVIQLAGVLKRKIRSLDGTKQNERS